MFEHNDIYSLESKERLETGIFQMLLFEVLKEMAKYEDSILKHFKGLATNKKKKKVIKSKNTGFKTNQQTIKSFIDGLVDYLLNE